MAQRDAGESGLSPEEAKKIDEIERAPIEELKYEIIPT